MQLQASIGSAAANTVSGKDMPTPQEAAAVDSTPQAVPRDAASSDGESAPAAVGMGEASDVALSPVMSALNPSVRPN
jgi:hypothetical protein